jgi:putative heme-binding domain-containing protein
MHPRFRPPTAWLALVLIASGLPALADGFDREGYARFALQNGGDPARGRRVFFDPNGAACANCHRAKGEGKDVGPDLSEIGNKFGREHLIESVLEPSRQIVEGYRPTAVALADGRVLTGLVKAETDETLTLVDAEARPQVVRKADVEGRMFADVSVMPEGLAARLSPGQFADLIAYLETLRSTPKPTPGSASTGPLTLPPGFTARKVVGGLTGATAMAVAPDGRVFVCEQTGALRVVRDGALRPEPFVTLKVDPTWERGLIGVALDPKFATNRYVYVNYVAADPYPHHRVSRFAARGDVAAPGSEVVLLEGDDQRTLGGNVPAGHQGGALHFGLDGALFVAIGDQTAGAPAQRLDTFQGKLLRINPDGSIPCDNPFASQAKGKYRAIWATGLRNPFTFAVHPRTGRIFINDVGQDRWEEVNEGFAGANYGWPASEGPTTDPRFRAPVYFYPVASVAGAAFCPPGFGGPSWAKYHGLYFFMDFVHGWVKTLDPEDPSKVETFANGLTRPVDLAFSPDGGLYVLLRDAWVVDDKFHPHTGSLLRIAASAPGLAASTNDHLNFVRARAAALRAGEVPVRTLDGWKERAETLRRELLKAWGGFPETPCPLEPRTLGVLQREGYRVEKIVFQTRPGVFMTANAYVPDAPGKHPAILAVHGHWRGAKQDPVVQARCIGAAKPGFFVLAVDAFGAGERGVGKALGEYHGEMTAATLLPAGLPLSGLQVYENTRAVDYLRTRPEVDGEKIGITGASGGGNQTMYAAAWDDRLKAAAAVCSVGNYRAYLGTACCLCELVPGALRFTEEWGVLGLTAPRALMVVNATRDAVQFSVDEAKKSLQGAEAVYRLYGKPKNLRHAVFESGHDYSRPMREAVYGWMRLHLGGEGDGAPVAEPEHKTEDPEALRCYPGDTRPDDFVTIPRFAAAEGRKLLAARAEPKDADDRRRSTESRREALVGRVFGGFPEGAMETAEVSSTEGSTARELRFEPEPGIKLSARLEAGRDKDAPLAVVLDLDGAKHAEAGKLAGEVRRAGWGLATLDLRATGALAWPSDKVGHAPDHTTAEWAMWIGRPMLGQWAFDVRRLLDAVEKADGKLPGKVHVIGDGPAGLVALAAAAVDRRIAGVAAVGTLASFVSDVPYRGQRLGVIPPGILREVGDVSDLATLAIAPRVVIAGGVSGGGDRLTPDQLRARFDASARAWVALGDGRAMVILNDPDPAEVVRNLR